MLFFVFQYEISLRQGGCGFGRRNGDRGQQNRAECGIPGSQNSNSTHGEIGHSPLVQYEKTWTIAILVNMDATKKMFFFHHFLRVKQL